MTNWTLSDEYYKKARIRRKALEVLMKEGGYSDVLREGQELVELLLKGLLRRVGIDPPKWHDVGQILVENSSRLPNDIVPNLDRITQISAYLRKERELSFYGDEDFIPSQQYSKDDAARCLNDIDWLLALVKNTFERKT